MTLTKEERNRIRAQVKNLIGPGDAYYLDQVVRLVDDAMLLLDTLDEVEAENAALREAVGQNADWAIEAINLRKEAAQNKSALLELQEREGLLKMSQSLIASISDGVLQDLDELQRLKKAIGSVCGRCEKVADCEHRPPLTKCSYQVCRAV